MSKIINQGQEIIVTAGSAIVAGTVVLVGQLLAMAIQPIAAAAQGALAVGGRVTVTKTAGAAWTQGQRIYWNSATSAFQTVPTDYYAGIAAAAAESDATAGDILLNAGAPSVERLAAIADPGDGDAIPVTGSGRVPLVTAAAETRTIAAPAFAGQRLVLELKTDGGDCVVTVATGLNQTGNNTATLADAGDILVLEAIEVGSNLRWRVTANDGAALSTAGSGS